MYGQHVVAIFPSAETAVAAKNQLTQSGIDDSSMRLSCTQNQDDGRESTFVGEDHKSFFEWLFGSDVPEKERQWYSSNLQRGRTALSIKLSDQSTADRIEPLLIEAGAIEVEEEDDDEMEQRQSAATKSASEEEVIPIVKEELEVGKRTKEDRHVIRTHVIEKPVEKQVNLRDETVVIERRPISGAQTANPEDLQDREYEVVERHEEPVVQKTAKAVEEVVVKKDVRDRTETVRGNIRQTKVETPEVPSTDRKTKP